MNIKHKPSITDEEYLYFGSVEVTFALQDGVSHDFYPTIFSDNQDQEAKDLANARFQPQHKLGPDYEKLIIPAVPAADPLFTRYKGKEPPPIPAFLKKPLVKKEGGLIHGLQSGRRSALIKVGSEWYRLKGCGDCNDGFPVLPIQEGSPWHTIRGCCFTHTSARDLHYQSIVNTAIASTNHLGANESTGWWEYDLGPSSPLPLVKRTCAISKTRGNRRLGDNLMTGLERLIPVIIGADLHHLIAQFPPERIDPDTQSIFETHMETLTHAFGGEMDLTQFDFKEHAPRSPPSDMHPRWGALWQQLCQTLEHYYACAPRQSLLPYLYWRFGRETGQIFDGLHSRDDELSWGTYTDHMGTHCNAHINNLVVLPRSTGRGKLLAPLDFDLAFSRSTFSKDESQWRDWMTLEETALRMCLAGDYSLTSGVTAVADLPPEYAVFKWALRDTCVVAFNSAMEKQQDCHAPDPNLEEACYALIGLALIVTEKEVA